MNYSIVNNDKSYNVEISHLMGKIHIIIDKQVTDFIGMDANAVDAFIDNMVQELECYEPEE